MSHFVLFHWIMIQIFIAHTASQNVIRGVIGQPVQLPCFYQVTRLKDISDMCWGRGPCPNSKCNNKILHTTGNRVTFRKSQRYSLQGYISYGDVSLTIGKVTAEDAGTYCCRIEIPGWFNDIKKNMQLEVVRAHPVMTTTTRKAPVSPKSFRKTTFAPQSTSDHHTTAEATVLTTAVPEATSATTDHQTTAETTVLLTTAIPEATSATTDHQTTAETTVLLTTAVPEATSATTDHQTTADTTVLLTTAVPEATSATTDHQTTAETTVLLTTAVPEATSATTDHQTTAETTVLLMTAVPEATSATTESPAVITVETIALPTFAVTANDTFPATIVTTSSVPDFPTGFQTTDMKTEAESVPLPGGTKVTTEFPSALLTAEGIKSAHPALVVEDVPTVGISSNSDVKDKKHNDNRDKFPSYAILIACVIVMSILFILMLSSLFWKRRHTKKFIIKSLGPAEDIEKVFSDAEGENNIFSL